MHGPAWENMLKNTSNHHLHNPLAAMTQTANQVYSYKLEAVTQKKSILEHLTGLELLHPLFGQTASRNNSKMWSLEL